MHSLLHLLLIQRDRFSQALEFEFRIPKLKVAKCEVSGNLFDYLDFEKTCKEKNRLVKAKFENFSNYTRMQDVYSVVMERNGKCNLASLKLFIVLTELDLTQLMEKFLLRFPEYRCVTKDFSFSQESLEQLKKESIREYNTFQIKSGVTVYKCEAVFWNDLFYLWKSDNDYFLFSKEGSLCIKATSYFEFIYKISIILLYSKRD